METLVDDIGSGHFSLIMVRILVALILSGLIGFERELNNHSAGFRTHILVGVGSCLMMLLSLYGFETYLEENKNIQFDPARIPSYVISGIGFLGAGTIIVNGVTIRGLTTAASIWTVAGLGLVIGAGMYSAAVFTTIVILLSLVFLNNVEKVFTKGRRRFRMRIVAGNKVKMGQIEAVIDSFHLSIRRMEIEKNSDDERTVLIEIEKGHEINQVVLFGKLAEIEDVKYINERD
ncbi:MgtC/SapB family protein [Aquibacillus sp. 3ASR75-11]|uniref:MgtC/SapB family protein n=1 Tax=Terrihalobacillus insolitus TaxID=2950438 RepID=A0A9X4AMM6_9BACI|nr:MgtC/SapB family protein [Terrihalobacillus insolitus]MDC3414674.1 MgtC/SapB family protein [Terrihalobacillus insolitus]MDC3425486.1 MgtC/SapB family protein [Terrihalobacillus insolitus]